MSWFKSFLNAFTQPNTARGSEMNNFTPRAQQVLMLARKEADRRQNGFIGTEHLLLGMLKLGQGTAVTVLQRMDVDLKAVAGRVEGLIGTGKDEKSSGSTPFTPRVKKVLLIAAREAKALGHAYVGTEHILLGLVEEGDGLGARVLKESGVNPEVTREYVMRELDPNYVPKQDERPMQKEGKNEPEKIDITQRYDVYCRDADQTVVYRNVLFKGMRTLFQKKEYDVLSMYLEFEQENGQTIFISRASVSKFCAHGVTPIFEVISNRKQ